MKRVSLEKLLKESDVVVLSITSEEENRNFVTREHFELMRDDSVFVNYSRPWLVDEEAFKWALDNKLAAAWVDFDLPFERDNLITTPHLGGTTVESTKKSEALIANKVKKIYE